MPKARDASASQEVSAPKQGRTEKSAETPPQPKSRSWLPAAGVAVAVALVGVIALGIVFTIHMGKTNIEIQLGAGVDAKDVKVVVKQDDQTVEVADAKEGWTIWLREGQYTLDLGESSDTFQLDKKSIVVRRGEPEVVHITLKVHEEADTTAKLAQSPHRISDARNYALAFDGNSHVELPEAVANSASGPFTIEAIVRADSSDATNATIIQGGSGYDVAIWARPRGSGFSIGASCQNAHERVLIMGNAEWNTLYHVAAVWDQARMQLFVNGKRLRCRQFLSLSPQNPTRSFIGRHDQVDDVNPRLGLKGIIDEVRISSIARYQDEFTPKTRFEPDEETVALYHFDEGSGNVVRDASGKNHHGKMVDPKWVECDHSSASLTSFDGAVPTFRSDGITMRLAETFQCGGGNTSLGFSPNGKNLLFTMYGPNPPYTPTKGTAKLLDIATGSKVHTIRDKQEWLRASAFSPDGKLFIVGSDSGWIKAFDTNSGREQFMSADSRRQHQLESVSFSPDGNRVVSACWDHCIYFWDATTGQQLKSIQEAHDAKVYRACYSADGELVASCCAGGVVKLWDAHSFELLRTLKGHKDRVPTVAFYPDGTKVVSGSWDGTIKIWDAHTGAELRSLQSHTDRVESVHVSPDRSLLASASSDGTVKIWDAEHGRLLLTIDGQHMGVVLSACFSPDGKFLATAHHHIKLWDIERETPHGDGTSTAARQEMGVEPAPVTIEPGQWVDVLGFVDPAIHTYTGNWHRDGDRLVVDQDEEDARIQIPVQPKGSYQLRLSFVRAERADADGSGGIGILLPVGDARTMLVLDHDTVRANGLNLVNGHGVGHADNPATVLKRLVDDGVACDVEVTVRLDGDNVAITARTGGQSFLDWSGPQSALSLADDWWEKGLTTLGLTVGQLAAVEVQQLEIKMLDAEAKRTLLSLRRSLVCDPAPIKGLLGWTIVTAQPRGPLRAIAYSPDGKLVATWGDDDAIRLWDPKSHKVVRVLTGLTGNRGCPPGPGLAWSPDGRHLAAFGNRWLTVTDTQSGRLVWRRLCPPSGSFLSVAYSPTGDLLAYSAPHAPQKGVCLIDAKSGRTVRQLDGYTGGHISSLAWSPDGKRLAGAGAPDHTTWLWNPTDGTLLATLKTGGKCKVGKVAWAPDGKTLLSYHKYGGKSAYLWNAETGEKLAEIPCLSDQCVWLPDGPLIASDSGNPHAPIWQLYDVKKREMVGGFTKVVGYPRMAASRDGRTIAMISADEFAIYDWANERLDVVTSRRASSLSLCWSPDGETLAVSDRILDIYDDDGFVEVWDAKFGARRQRIRGSTDDMAFSPDAQVLACGMEGVVFLRAIETGGLVAQFHIWADQMAWSGDGHRLATASDRVGFVGIWDAETRKLVHQIPSESAFKPGSGLLISNND